MHAQRVFQIDPFSTLPLYISLISAGIILTAVCFFWSPLKKFRPIRIFSVLISLCAVLGAYTYISDIVNIYLLYRRGEYQIVTGEVEHYNKRPDTSQPKYIELSVGGTFFPMERKMGKWPIPKQRFLKAMAKSFR
ncbi:hypothetical protein KFE19_00200 [Dysosmobacter sp. Marseille-Q4140]|nr:hypothetical protein KFE19_00200 [Dysosmobacter sp. Marseille-Q4140]